MYHLPYDVRLAKTHEPLFNRKQKGFALIFALGLMTLVVLTSVSLSVMVRTETAQAEIGRQQEKARQQARLAAGIGLGNLQKAAGVDTRATGRSNLLSDELTILNTRWAGVWSEVDPGNRQQEPTLVTWLVSGNSVPQEQSDGTFADPDHSPDDNLSAAADGLVLARYTAEDGTNREVTVPRQQVGDGSIGFWVQDEGVKANISSSAEPSRASTNVWEARMAGLGQLQSGLTALSTFSGMESISDYQDLLRKTQTPESLLTWAGSQVTANDLEQTEEAFTFHSAGVQANARLGGLKRDLSLAFELPLSAFNAQSEFFDEEISLANLDYDVGYVFREPAPNGLPGEIKGTTWQLLRDYYQLYRSVRDGDSYPVMAAQAHYPNTLEVYDVSDPTSLKRRMTERNLVNTYNEPQDVFTQDTANSHPFGTVPLIRPSGTQVAPYIQRVLLFMSLQSLPSPQPGASHMAIVVDPVVALWNPYNVALEVPAVKIRMRNFNVDYNVAVTRGSNAPDDAPEYNQTQAYEMGLASRHSNVGASTSASQDFLYFVATSNGTNSVTQPPITLAPGEIKLFSMTNTSPQPLNTNLYAAPGFNISGGAYYENIVVPRGSSPSSTPYEPLLVYPGDTVDLDMTVSLGHFFFATYLVDQSRIGVTNVTTAFDHLFDPQIQEVEVLPFWVANNLQNMAPVTAGTTAKMNVATLDFFINPLGTNSRAFPLLASNSFTAPVQFARMSNGKQEGDFLGFWNAQTDNTASFILPQGLQTVGDDNTGTTWGESFSSPAAGGQPYVSLLSVPTTPPLSLAMLKGTSTAISPYHPEEAIGNSLANPLVAREAIAERNSGGNYTIFDLSYLLNEALWDDFFFSGFTPLPDPTTGFAPSPAGSRLQLEARIDAVMDGEPLPNPRMRLLSQHSTEATGDALKADNGFREAAAYLLQEGTFNVNSTSVSAWAAFLGILNNGDEAYVDPATKTIEASLNTVNVVKSFDLAAGPEDEAWRGFRTLDSTEILSLAEAIVDQVRLRGPFTSLSAFVNRRLSLDSEGLSGALQAALDASALNANPAWSVGETEKSAHDTFPHNDHLREETGFSIPGNITQADLLLALGPMLNVRSDTFKIRAYGETDEGAVAVCEVLIQRLPDYIDPADNAWQDPVSPTNLAFGRRFEILDWRWLSIEDL